MGMGRPFSGATRVRTTLGICAAVSLFFFWQEVRPVLLSSTNRQDEQLESMDVKAATAGQPIKVVVKDASRPIGTGPVKMVSEAKENSPPKVEVEEIKNEMNSTSPLDDSSSRNQTAQSEDAMQDNEDEQEDVRPGAQDGAFNRNESETGISSHDGNTTFSDTETLTAGNDDLDEGAGEMADVNDDSNDVSGDQNYLVGTENEGEGQTQIDDDQSGSTEDEKDAAEGQNGDEQKPVAVAGGNSLAVSGKQEVENGETQVELDSKGKNVIIDGRHIMGLDELMKVDLGSDADDEPEKPSDSGVQETHFDNVERWGWGSSSMPRSTMHSKTTWSGGSKGKKKGGLTLNEEKWKTSWNKVHGGNKKATKKKSSWGGGGWKMKRSFGGWKAQKKKGGWKSKSSGGGWKSKKVSGGWKTKRSFGGWKIDKTNGGSKTKKSGWKMKRNFGGWKKNKKFGGLGGNVGSLKRKRLGSSKAGVRMLPRRGYRGFDSALASKKKRFSSKHGSGGKHKLGRSSASLWHAKKQQKQMGHKWRSKQQWGASMWKRDWKKSKFTGPAGKRRGDGGGRSGKVRIRAQRIKLPRKRSFKAARGWHGVDFRAKNHYRSVVHDGKRLPYYCMCRVRRTKREGACYFFTNVRAGVCARRQCAPTYVCAGRGRRTGITCIRRKRVDRIVHEGWNKCRTAKIKEWFYVPYRFS